MEIHFSKMYENGNDFIVVDEWEHTVIPDDLKGQFAAIYCDRRFGIGADGVIFLTRSEKSTLRMRLFQKDEGEADMCGIGIRCLAKYAYDAGYVQESCTVETLAGEVGVTLGYKEDQFVVAITMPPPAFARKKIPATGRGEYHERIGTYEVYAANTGRPHAVIMVDDVDKVDLGKEATAICHHRTFPKGANVDFAEKTGPSGIRTRTFERDTEEEALSCGPGAMASAAVLHRLGLVGDVVDVETRGGPLVITLKDGGATIEGTAVTVFTGAITY